MFLRRFILLASVACFLWAILGFHSPRSGFSSLIQVGDKSGTQRILDGAPCHIYRDSWGYDGQYYLQLALEPTLREPALRETVDNLPYRAQRILVPWLAWLAGLGQPAWVVQAYALANVVAWLLLGWLLLRWLPPTHWQYTLRWLCILFSAGLLNSVRCALTDAPALLLLLSGIALLECRRPRSALLAFAATLLCRETLLLSVGASLAPLPSLKPRDWLKASLRLALALLPFLLWLAYIKWQTRGIQGADGAVFSAPLSGYLGRWVELIAQARLYSSPPYYVILGMLAHASLSVQLLFIALRPRPSELWWRVGAASCLLLVLLGTPVWEDYPGAALRVLLPLHLAFNLLVPLRRCWLPVLLLGNLSLLAGLHELQMAPSDPVRWSGPTRTLSSLNLEYDSSWYPPEKSGARLWVWCRSEPGTLLISNSSDHPIRLRLAGDLRTLQPGAHITLAHDSQILWQSAPTSTRFTPFASPPLTLPLGKSALHFSSDRPPQKPVSGDTRPLTFALQNLSITAE